MKTLNALIILIIGSCLNAKEPVRTWTSSDGRTLEARYLEMVGTKVHIENAQGRKFTVPLTGFSSADQEYVKKIYERSLFSDPKPFEDDGRGGVIVASAKGQVQVLVPPRTIYSKVKVKAAAREVIVGESLASGAILATGSESSADLLFTNGTLAHLGENTKLVLSALYQKSFKGTNQNAGDLKKEVSPSRTALNLQTGDLVVEVRKLSIESSFLIRTNVAQAGIRGTQFKVSASANSSELSVLEGRVDFLDAKEMTIPVETGRKAGVGKRDSAKVEDMSAGELAEVKKTVEQTKKLSADIDLNRMANTVDGYTPKPNYIVKSAVDMEMIWCPPGSFIMGPSGEGSPAHSVILTKGFYLGKYEVTQEQYQKVVRKNPSYFKGNTLPVEYVSWKEAVAFCRVLNKMERTLPGWEFALPTEAEWEYACRAGTTTAYSWGNDVSPQLANYEESGLKKTVQVGSYKANPWGFYDMHGNIAELTGDWYGDYSSWTVTDPKGAESGSDRVTRGSSYYTDELSMLSVARRYYSPGNRGTNIGFRIAFKLK